MAALIRRYYRIRTAGWGATLKDHEGFFWGGTWICCSRTGTDNAENLSKISCFTMTTDADVMKEIVVDR
ncbi:MAG: hypothetical protein ACLVCH_06890 [Roseburia inulinivorans]